MQNFFTSNPGNQSMTNGSAMESSFQATPVVEAATMPAETGGNSALTSAQKYATQTLYQLLPNDAAPPVAVEGGEAFYPMPGQMMMPQPVAYAY